jgi:phosphoglycolate phosphatase
MNAASRKFIVWDWNGTLLDDAPTVLACINLVLEKFACKPLSMDAMRTSHMRTIEELYASAGVPQAELPSILACDRDFFHDAYEPRADHVALRAGATGILGRLAANDVANVILSNHITPQIVRLLKRHDIHHFFDDVLGFTSREMQFREKNKDERIGDYIAARGLNPENALAIGDSAEEIALARRRSMASVAITGGLTSEERLRDAKPDYVVHSLLELEPILEERRFVA